LLSSAAVLYMQRLVTVVAYSAAKSAKDANVP
jgi:hypothetical protein